jgi:hypothetical protein
VFLICSTNVVGTGSYYYTGDLKLQFPWTLHREQAKRFDTDVDASNRAMILSPPYPYYVAPFVEKESSCDTH